MAIARQAITTSHNNPKECETSMRRQIPFLAAMCCLLSLAAFAQTPTPPARTGATAPATSAGAPAATGADGRLAVINTGAFRVGIAELKVKLDALNSEFEPRNKELEAIQNDINNLKNKIQTQGPTVQATVRNQWVEEGTEKEKTLKRKSEDYDALAKKRFEEVTAPVYDKIGKFLESYAQQRGISMVIEGAAAQQNGLLVFAAAATDITEDFMKEYNRLNPSAGAAATPARKP